MFPKKASAIAIVIIVLVAVMVPLVLLARAPAPNFGTPVGAVAITTGDETSVTSGSVSHSGGTMQVTTASSPLNGLEIEVPAAATDENISFNVSYADVSSVTGLPANAAVASKMITIETNGSDTWNESKAFNKAVLVTLPYDPDLAAGDGPVRFYAYDENNKTLEAVGFSSQDNAQNTISFYTRTFSKFVAIELSMTVAELLGSDYSVDTGFRPATDGWYITNYGSYLESGGLCMGMVSYAKFYYTYLKPFIGAGLYGKYREGDPNEWRDDATAIQLATRAHTAESDVWDQTWKHEIQTQVPSSKDVALSWIHGMVVTGTPQLIGIYEQVASGDWTGGHAILTYKYSGGNFEIYDPNHPGTAPGTAARQIPFTLSSGFTQAYQSGTTAADSAFNYNVFLHFGYKMFHPFLSFINLHLSAEKKFQDDTLFPDVILTDSTTDPVGSTPTDTDGDGIRDTSESKITISGTIKGGKAPVNSTLIFVSNQKFEVKVDNQTGVFSQEVPLFQGNNDVIILATDTDTFSNWAGYHRETIKSNASLASLTLTLTWGQDQSDVDLHVLEPTIGSTAGRHIYYSNKGSGYGYPYLDMDDTTGYGPEHYYATESMILPNSADNSLYGAYKFRVHYYADHDQDTESTQPITWNVSARYLAYKDVARNKEYWVDKSWSGSLAAESTSGTSNFNSSGSSWSQIYELDYEKPNPATYGTPNPPQNVLP
ncbi:MAG: hypothetical protein AB1476_05150 [Candidatus Hadarchaeota archaeon]